MQTKQTTTIMMMFHTNLHKERKKKDRNTLRKNRANEMFNGDNNDQNNCAKKKHDFNLH